MVGAEGSVVVIPSGVDAKLFSHQGADAELRRGMRIPGSQNAKDQKISPS